MGRKRVAEEEGQKSSLGYTILSPKLARMTGGGALSSVGEEET